MLGLPCNTSCTGSYLAPSRVSLLLWAAIVGVALCCATQLYGWLHRVCLTLTLTLAAALTLALSLTLTLALALTYPNPNPNHGEVLPGYPYSGMTRMGCGGCGGSRCDAWCTPALAKEGQRVVFVHLFRKAWSNPASQDNSYY